MNILTYVPLGVATPVVDLVNISIANAGIVALLGYAVVFFGLILLMCVITILGKAFTAAEAKAKAAAAAAKKEG
jgi:Na+-transporting methylmalonyl-CoA/oxaloacetate decarboxylase gamma subunit